MANRYLLDTNTCIQAYQRGNLAVHRRMRAVAREALFIPSLVVAELATGVMASQKVESNRASMNRFLGSFQVLPWTEKAAWHYATARNRLKALGQLIGPIDLLLAAQALTENMVFVTSNRDEFDRVEGLTVEDWTV